MTDQTNTRDYDRLLQPSTGAHPDAAHEEQPGFSTTVDAARRGDPQAQREVDDTLRQWSGAPHEPWDRPR